MTNRLLQPVTDVMEARNRMLFAIADIIERETCHGASVPCQFCSAEAKVLIDPFCTVLVSACHTAAGAKIEFKEATVIGFAAARLRKYLNDTLNVTQTNSQAVPSSLSLPAWHRFRDDEPDQPPEESSTPPLSLIRRPR